MFSRISSVWKKDVIETPKRLITRWMSIRNWLGCSWQVTYYRHREQLSLTSLQTAKDCMMIQYRQTLSLHMFGLAQNSERQPETNGESIEYTIMTSQRLITKYPLTWHNQANITVILDLALHVHTGNKCIQTILMTIMQDMIFNCYSGRQYVCSVTWTITRIISNILKIIRIERHQDTKLIHVEM